MNIEEIMDNDQLVAEVKEKPVVYTFILVAAVVMAYMAFNFPDNENMGFAMTTLSVVVALMGLKGIVWPRKFYQYKPTKEIIVRKEYYFSSMQQDAVKKCVAMEDPVCCIKMMEALPQDGGTGLRVIVYATKSGSYHKVQMQKYIPYEYVPM